MPFKFFTIPLIDDGQAASELNAFLRNNKILSVDRRCVSLPHHPQPPQPGSLSPKTPETEKPPRGRRDRGARLSTASDLLDGIHPDRRGMQLAISPDCGRTSLGVRSRGSSRVIRGGSWNNNARNCRAANRNRNTPDNRNNNLGFRLALAPPEQRMRLRTEPTAPPFRLIFLN